MGEETTTAIAEFLWFMLVTSLWALILPWFVYEMVVRPNK